MEKIDPPYKKKCEYLGLKHRVYPFFFKSRTYELQKNRPFLSEIQNDDAYLLYVGVAGPGQCPTLSPGTVPFFSCCVPFLTDILSHVAITSRFLKIHTSVSRYQTN